MNMKRARFWRNLLLFSALSGAASLPQTYAQEGVSRVGNGSAGPGSAGVPTPEGFAPLSPSPYMPLDPGYNFPRPMPPGLPPTSDTLRNSRRDSFGPRFDIGQFLGDRLGVNDNDTNFNFLLPYLMGSENDVLFIDGRGVATSLGKGAASAGIGFRSYDPTFNRIFGISGWVDYDQGHARTYQQAGISFESLGTWMDVRVNGYIPFGTTSNLVGNSTVPDSLDMRTFGGISLLSNLQRQLTESAYRGLDAEIGGPLPLLGRYGVSGYVGGYWLDSKTDAVAAGPRVRFEANVTDSMRVSMIASNDPVFGTNAWVNMNLTLPDGRARRWFRPTEVQDRLLRTVERSYRVQTHTRTDLVPTPLFVPVPETPNNLQGGIPGQPVRVIFVDPDRLTNGNGTLESPFNTLQGFANVAANTLIVVDGSLSGKTVAGNLTLFGGQKLVSTSILASGGVQLDTNLGLITVPAPTGFGDANPVSPVFTNPAGGTLVTLGGNSIEVAGITFDGSTSNAAIPNATGIAGANFSNFNIHHNTFRDYKDAVVMSNVRGVGLFQANTLTGTPGVSVDGFRLTNSGVGSLDLFINSFEPPVTGAGSSLVTSANSFTGNDNAGINITARNRAVINTHIVDNTISNNGQGIILDAAATRSVINASIVNNVIDGNRGEDRNLNGILDPGEDLNRDGVLNTGNGVLLMANASTLNLAQLGEDVNSNGVLDLSEDTNGNGAFDHTEDLNGNGKLDVSEDKNGNGILDTGEDTNGDGLLDTTITEDKNGNGVLDKGEDSNGNSVIDTTTNEDKNGNGKLDPSEDKNGNGKLDASEDKNSNGRLDGGYFLGNNTITRNTGNGIAVQSLNNSVVNLFVVANNIGDPADHSTGNRGRGMSIIADSGTVNANIGFLPNEDKNFNGKLDLTEDTNGNGILDAGEDANGNETLDLSEDTNGNGTLDGGDPLDANHFVANREGGLFVDLSGTAIGNIVAINNTITGQGSGSLTFTEDLNSNGILDAGEDTNGNLRLDRSFVIAGVNSGTATGNPFSFVNNSQQGNSITGLNWNLASAALEFNTTGVNSTLFTPANATEIVTGLTTVNGTSNPIQVTDQATALNLQFATFQSTNGVLDVGEDANANGVLDPGEDRPSQFDFNIGTSGAGGAPTLLSGANFIGSQIVATFSSGQVLTGTMQAVAGSLTDSEFVPSANGNNSGSGPGIELRVSQTAVLNSPTFVGNNIQFNGGAGFTARATEDGQINNLLLQANTIQNNGTTTNGGGIDLSTVAASSAQINGSIVDNSVLNNSGPGILATADSGTIELLQINNNILTGNTNAVSLNTLNSGTIASRVTNNTMDGSTGDGFAANANNGTITLNQFTANSLTNSGGNGILFNATNGGTINLPPTEDLNGNLILDDGEDINGNGFLDLGMFLNDVSNSAGNGLSITGTGGNFNLGTISGLTSNRSTTGQGGIVIDVTDSVLSGQFVGNSLIGSPNNPLLGLGFSLTATNGTFDVSIGGPNDADRNLFQNNAGAGIAILAQNTAVGTFRIQNNRIFGTTNDLGEDLNGNGVLDPTEDTNGNGVLNGNEDRNGNGILDPAEDINGNGVLDAFSTPFSGEGIFIGARGQDSFSLATALVSNSVILNNAIGGTTATAGNNSHGIAFDFREETTLRNLTISDNRIGNNGGDGINFRRFDNAVVENVVISQNLITLNGEDLLGTGVLAGQDRNLNGQLDGDGIRIAASEGGRSILGFDLRGNEITLNRLSGIHMNVAADALLNVDIGRNLIDANGTTVVASLANFASGNGILTTEDFGHSTDMREIGGDWVANTITNSFARGIRIDATSTNIFNEIAATNSPNALPANNLLVGGNLIDSNGFDGILINGPGRLTIDSNTITNNGVSAGLAAATAVATATGSDNGNGIAIRSVLLDQFGNVANQTLAPELMLEPSSQLLLRAAGPKFVEVLRNEIRGNSNDGIEIRHANNPSLLHDAELHPGFFPLTAVIQANTIDTNGLRGIDILNQGGFRLPEHLDVGPPETGATDSVDSPVSTIPGTSNQFSPTDTTVRLVDNKISSNNKEGIYVVNAGSLTQGQSGNTPVPSNPEDPTRGMLTDGDVASVPRLALEVHHNLVIKNGQQLNIDVNGAPIDTITGSGLVIRSGTTDNAIAPVLFGQGVDANGNPNAGFADFASAPGGTAVALFGETGFRNADEIIASTGANFGSLGFFNRLQPGGIIAKVTNNGLDDQGQRDLTSGFEGNFGADVYVGSFRDSGAGVANQVVARLDMIFEHNSGDSLDVTNFGAFFDQNPQRNGQNLSTQLNIPGVTLPIFGRVVGVHNSRVTDDPGTGIDDATRTSFFASDAVDPPGTPLDDRAAVYDLREVVFTTAADTDADASIVSSYSGLAAGTFFALNTAVPTPINNQPFRVELSIDTLFDAVLFDADPRTNLSAAILRGTSNIFTGAFLNGGASLVFIDETPDPFSGLPTDPQQPVRVEQAVVINNFANNFGRAQATNNPNIFHVAQGNFVDRVSNVAKTGRGPISSNSDLPGLIGLQPDQKTSNQTIQLQPGLSRAPRDGNLFVITSVSFGQGPSAFRVSGATVAAQAQLGINVNTNRFTSKNLGFDDAVSLESGNPQLDERPFEWGVLPTANRTRILSFFPGLSPLGAAPQSYRDFTFPRIVFP